MATQDFTDASFKKGLAAQSQSLGDPTDPHNEANIVLIVQSDDRDDVFDQVEDSINDAPSVY